MSTKVRGGIVDGKSDEEIVKKISEAQGIVRACALKAKGQRDSKAFAGVPLCVRKKWQEIKGAAGAEEHEAEAAEEHSPETSETPVETPKTTSEEAKVG
jgi:hypothetical protein